jgi:hypothetical protein
LVPFSRVSPRLVRWTLGVFLFAAVFWTPQIAAASEIYADIDHDGIRDVVSIESIPRTGLRVWLSKSNVTLTLTTRRPITHVAASDLDGDGHIDLVAADSAAKVHVWHRTARGHLRPVRPRGTPWRDAVSTRRVRGAQDDGPGPALVEGVSTDAVADVQHSWPPSPHILSAISTNAPAPSSGGAALPRDPRGPPTV